MARDAIKANKCVVIGLQSTGEARTLETLEEMGGELTEFVSTAKCVVFHTFVSLSLKMSTALAGLGPYCKA